MGSARWVVNAAAAAASLRVAAKWKTHAARPPPPAANAAVYALPNVQAAAAASGGKLFGVCVLERLPVIIPDPPEWEQEHREWQQVRSTHAPRCRPHPHHGCLCSSAAGCKPSLRWARLHRLSTLLPPPSMRHAGLDSAGHHRKVF